MAFTQTLYINSALRLDGSPSDFRVALGTDALSARDDYESRLIVTEATISRSWYNVSLANNSFTVQSDDNPPVVESIRVGNYNVLDMRSALNSALRRLNPSWDVSYSRISSTYLITRPNDDVFTYTINLGGLSTLLGFENNSFVILNQQLPAIRSPNPARISQQNCVFIHCDITKSGNAVLDNSLERNMFTDSTIICKLPINAPPDDNIVYMANDLSNSIRLINSRVDTMRLFVTDENYKRIPLLFDWTATLLVTHTPKDTNQDTRLLEEARDYLQLLALEKASR